MEYKIEGNSAKAVVICSGRLTFSDATMFHRLSEEIKQTRGRAWLLDFARLDFIDSAGLGMLLMARDVIERQGGKLSIRAAEGQVRKAFDLAKFQELIGFEA